MNKKQMATWLAKVSFANGKNTMNGMLQTLDCWINHYMKFTIKELQEEMSSYGC